MQGMTKEKHPAIINNGIKMSEETKKLNWYHFRQNNTGGSFTGPAISIYVQATDSEEADRIAEDNGAYFDGSGDCMCCGFRWNESWGAEDDDFDIEDIRSAESHRWAVMEGVQTSLIVFADGKKEEVQ